MGDSDEKDPSSSFVLVSLGGIPKSSVLACVFCASLGYMSFCIDEWTDEWTDE
jgi:hypothetical protein